MGRLGRRGRPLLGFAVLDVVWGVRLATVDPATTDFYAWLNSVCPLWWWSLPWFVVAALCLVGAVRRRDQVAFGGAIFIKWAWASLCLYAELFGDVADAWPQAALFGAFAWCVWCMAVMTEPADPRGDPWTPPLP